MEWKLCTSELFGSRYNGLVPHTAAVEDGLIFALQVPENQKASLVLRRRKGGRKEYEVPFPDRPYSGNIYAMHLSGAVASDVLYCFKTGGKLIADPYAQLLDVRGSYGEKKEKPLWAGFADGGFDFGEDEKRKAIPYRDSVFYEVNVRSFTRSKTSGVKYKGTFQGLAEKIPYLKSLGITAVVLMPAYEFDETAVRLKKQAGIPGMQLSESFRKLDADRLPDHVPSAAASGNGSPERVNLWGFGPGFLLAPKRGYCATEDPYREFCGMVKAFHEAGLEVLMEMDFSKTPDPTLCQTALLSWKQVYHVDGFVLYGRQDLLNMICSSPSLSDCKLISDYFPADVMYPDGRKSAFRNLAELNYGFRNDARKLLKGDENCLWTFASRSRYNPEDTAVINAITDHDGFTMMDLVSYDHAHNEENGDDGGDPVQFSWNCGTEGPTRRKDVLRLRLRQIKNAFTMMLLSQGTPMILAGDEFGNSQMGNSNAWSIDSELTWLRWAKSSFSREIYDYVKKLIAFRKAHPILHLESQLTTDSRGNYYPEYSCHGTNAWFATFSTQDRSIGMMYCGYDQDRETVEEKPDSEKGTEPASYLYIAYNFHWERRQLALPILPRGREWKIVLNTSEMEAEAGKSVSVPGRTVLALEG